jgi:flavin-dependent dehydrogenase
VPQSVEACEVAIVGGGPAGSSAAWALRRAGLDVVVCDTSAFPRDKVCAGWITPPVVDLLRLDVDDYRRTRTFQPITGFRVGVIGGPALEIDYDRPVSFGIRRCEFDDYLLRRSGARLRLGRRIETLRRDGASWIVNETLRAAVLIGAGGHFCPVARMLNGPVDRAPLVAAQEIECAIAPRDAGAIAVDAERPELYFCPDFKGYGWCFRKADHLNIGFGRQGARALPQASARFVDFVTMRGRIPADPSWRWRGHAYLLSGARGRRAIDEGVLLAGDAAGLAYPQSGEGIRPAIESGLLAASAIVAASGRYTADRLARYDRALRRRFGIGAVARVVGAIVPPPMTAAIAARLLARPWFVRRVLLDRWFLHEGEPGLATLTASASTAW